MSNTVLPAPVAEACWALLSKVENRIEELGLGSKKHALKSAIRNLSRETELEAGSFEFVVNILRDGNDLARSYAEALGEPLIRPGVPECSVEPGGASLREPSNATVDERDPVQEQQIAAREAPPAANAHDTTEAKEPTNPDSEMAVEVSIETIKLSPDFEFLFGPDTESYPHIVESMKERGYDRSEPLVVWAGSNTLVDGHQRFKASREAGLKSVWVLLKHFGDGRQALIYAVKRQTCRRSLTDGQLFRLVQKIDTPQGHGGDRRSAATRIKTPNEVLIRSSSITAEQCAISKTKVEKIRALSMSGLGDLIKAVENDKLSIHAAYEQLQERRGRRTKPPSDEQRSNKPQPKEQEPSAHPESRPALIESVPNVGAIGIATRRESVSDQAQRAPRFTVVELESWISTVMRLIDEMEALSFPLASQMTAIQRELDSWKNRIKAEAGP